MRDFTTTTGNYKEFLYKLLQDPECRQEYLAVCKADTEDPEAYETALKNVEEAKKWYDNNSKSK